METYHHDIVVRSVQYRGPGTEAEIQSTLRSLNCPLSLPELQQRLNTLERQQQLRCEIIGGRRVWGLPNATVH